MPLLIWKAGSRDAKAGDMDRKLRIFPFTLIIFMKWEERAMHRRMIKANHLE